MKEVRVGDFVEFIDRYGKCHTCIVVAEKLENDNLKCLIYHPAHKNHECCYINPTRFDSWHVSWVDKFELRKITNENEKEGELTMESKELLKRVEELEKDGFKIDEFIIMFSNIQPKEEKETPKYYDCGGISRKEKDYLSEFYYCLNSRNSFEDNFRCKHTNNQIMKDDLRKLFVYTQRSNSWDEDAGFRKIKRALFDIEFFKKVLQNDIEQFVKFGDRNHYRDGGKCYVKTLGSNSLEYPKMFNDYCMHRTAEINKINEGNISYYSEYRKRYDAICSLAFERVAYKGSIPSMYISKMKSFMSYIAYRDHIYKTYKGDLRGVKLGELDERFLDLIHRGEEYKMFFILKNEVGFGFDF